MRATTWLVTAAVGIGLVAGVADADETRPPTVVSAFAAASLTEAFRAIGTEFERGHLDLRVEFNFAGSPTLVQQIQQGAPADVFASADEPNMAKLLDSLHVAGAPRVFARNQLAIVVGPGNPQRVTGLPDLARPGLVVVLCGPTVPAGRYAREAFQKAGVAVPEGSQEIDVKAVVAKVALGEADAGVVYATDVRAAGDRVAGVLIPSNVNVVARYPIAVLKEADQPEAARAFVTFVLAPEGRRILERFGFGGP